MVCSSCITFHEGLYDFMVCGGLWIWPLPQMVTMGWAQEIHGKVVGVAKHGSGCHRYTGNIILGARKKHPDFEKPSCKHYLGGQGDLVSRLRRGIIGVTIWVIGVINLLTKSP